MEFLSKQKLRNAMLAKGVGVSQLAEKAGLQPLTVTKLLKGDTPCRLPTISKLATALQINPTDLLVND